MRAIKWTSILGEKGNRFFDIRSGGSATTLPALKLVRWRDSKYTHKPLILEDITNKQNEQCYH